MASSRRKPPSCRSTWPTTLKVGGRAAFALRGPARGIWLTAVWLTAVWHFCFATAPGPHVTRRGGRFFSCPRRRSAMSTPCDDLFRPPRGRLWRLRGSATMNADSMAPSLVELVGVVGLSRISDHGCRLGGGIAHRTPQNGHRCPSMETTNAHVAATSPETPCAPHSGDEPARGPKTPSTPNDPLSGPSGRSAYFPPRFFGDASTAA